MRWSIILFVFFLFGCNSDVDPFYKNTRDWDLWVLPLIKPYKLTSPIRNQSLWQLEFKIAYEFYPPDTVFASVNVTEINIKNGVIFGRGHSPTYYFVIIPALKVEKVFDNENSWEDFLNQLNISKHELYNVLEVYNASFENHKNLPWYHQIKKER